MKIHELKVGKYQSKRRLGRGISAGQGKTAGRGTKGQRSRTGSSKKPGFEGGQTKIMQRLPKLRGFKSKRHTVEVVYLQQLNDLGAKIDNAKLAEAGLVSNPHVEVKLISKGELTKKVDVSLQFASKSAVEAIDKKGGSFTVVARQGRPSKKADK